jgi:hypothetical protein
MTMMMTTAATTARRSIMGRMTLDEIVGHLEKALPGSSSRLLEVWDMLDRGNEHKCPRCTHPLGHHDSTRSRSYPQGPRCHWGWTSHDSGGCMCGR